MTITRDLYAARNRDFAQVLELDYSGAALPLSGATISMQVRQYAGQAGAAEAEDTSVTFSDADNGDGTRTLTLEPSIAKATLAAMPTGLNQPEAGEADVFAYEIKLTYADSAQDSLWIGNFILEPGVDAT
jgi:hypothetical protein